MNPMVTIVAGALLLLLGAGLGYWIGSRRESDKTGEVQAELDAYRQQVTEHFSATAAHFQAIGAEYRKLYEHMADGAGQLCQGGEAVSFEPVEKLAAGTVIDESDQPRDYEIAESEAGEQELPEIVTGESSDESADEPQPDKPAAEAAADAEAVTAEEPVDAEPTDERPAETEVREAALEQPDETKNTEELLAERELSADESSADKTLH
jgi:uncharacterized membrane-anchored protein YhcB (DUF1043 family)